MDRSRFILCRVLFLSEGRYLQWVYTMLHLDPVGKPDVQLSEESIVTIAES